MSGFTNEPFAERWRLLTLPEQLGNVGSEVERVINWRNRNKLELATSALYRTLDLLDLTINDPRWVGGKRKELTRIREILCDMFVGNNLYNTSPDFLRRYFLQFGVAANANKNKLFA